MYKINKQRQINNRDTLLVDYKKKQKKHASNMAKAEQKHGLRDPATAQKLQQVFILWFNYIWSLIVLLTTIFIFIFIFYEIARCRLEGNQGAFSYPEREAVPARPRGPQAALQNARGSVQNRTFLISLLFFNY